MLIGGYGRALATTDGLAGTLGNLALYDIPLSEVQAYTGKVEAVAAADVQRFAAEVLDPSLASVIVAGDAKLFAAELTPLMPGAETIPLSELDLDSPTLRKAP